MSISSALQMNMLLTYKVLGLRPEEVQVVLWDKFADGPYRDLIQKAFSPQHPVQRHTHYRGKVSWFVCMMVPWYGSCSV
jgi:hypothetical protein